jgi:hypothetical protein
VIIDFPLFGKIEMTPEAHARYAASMTKYYEKLPPTAQPECWREERQEREAIEEESRIAQRERRIFTKRVTR